MQNTVLYGANNTIDDALVAIAKYEAKGIQSVGNYSFETGKAKHDIDFGIRYMRIMRSFPMDRWIRNTKRGNEQNQ
jgi:outer membrane receptor for Fe3+-dicitrate